MRGKVALLLLLCAAGAATSVHAQSVAASLTVGTNGPGLMLSTGLTEKLNLRAGGSYFPGSYEGEHVFSDTDVAFEGDARLLMIGALADYYPFGGGFRLTGGAYYNGLQGDGEMRLLEDYVVEGRRYTPEEVGVMALDLQFDRKLAPYIGLGVGNPLDGRIGFVMDFGAVYMGSPNITIDSDGMLEPMEEEGEQIEENLSWVQWYPVFSIGVSARLF